MAIASPQTEHSCPLNVSCPHVCMHSLFFNSLSGHTLSHSSLIPSVVTLSHTQYYTFSLPPTHTHITHHFEATTVSREDIPCKGFSKPVEERTLEGTEGKRGKAVRALDHLCCAQLLNKVTNAADHAVTIPSWLESTEEKLAVKN